MKSTVSFRSWTLSLSNGDLDTRPPPSLPYVSSSFVCHFHNDYSNLHSSLDAPSPIYPRFIRIQLNICVNDTARCFVGILSYNIDVYDSMAGQLEGLEGGGGMEQYGGLWMGRFEGHAVHRKSSEWCIQDIRNIMTLNIRQWYVRMAWLAQLQAPTKERSMTTPLFGTLAWNGIFSESAVAADLYTCLETRPTSIWTASSAPIQEDEPLLAIRQPLIAAFQVYGSRLNRLLDRLRTYGLTTLSVLNCVLDCSQWLLTI